MQRAMVNAVTRRSRNRGRMSAPRRRLIPGVEQFEERTLLP